MTSTQVVHGRELHGVRSSAFSTSTDSSVSLAGSVLAVLPAVYGVSLTLPVSGFEWNPVEYAILGVAFYLASVLLAAIDEHHLRQAGVVYAATAYWSLLTPMPYLIARTRALIAADQPGLALLWIAIASSLVTGVALAILAAS